MTDEAIELLDDAAQIIDGKDDEHGDAEDSFGRIAAYWTTYLQIEHNVDVSLDQSDVAEMMALFKLARAQSGRYNDDDYRDRLGYVAFASEHRD